MWTRRKKTLFMDEHQEWGGHFDLETLEYVLYVKSSDLDYIPTDVFIVDQACKWHCWLKKASYDKKTDKYQLVYKDY